MEDPTSLLVTPARIFHDGVDGKHRSMNDSLNDIYGEVVNPVNIIVCRTNTPSHYDYDHIERPFKGQALHRVVTAYGGYGYGKLPFWLSCIQNGHHDLSMEVIDARKKERMEMQDLNEKFADYIEKVRYLEAENRNLSKELSDLKSKWGRETKKMKIMYGLELSDTRKLLDDLDKNKATLEIKVTSLEERLLEANDRILDLEGRLTEERQITNTHLEQIADLQSRCGYLTRKTSDLELDKDRNLARISKLIQQLEKAKAELEDETLLHIDGDNMRRTLEEQMNFMNIVHEQEMKELASLVCRDSTSENREFWKIEIDKTMKEIIQLFEEQMKTYEDNVETSYDSKIREYMSETGFENIQNSKDESLKVKDYIKDLNRKLQDYVDKNQLLIKEIESLRRHRDGLHHDGDVYLDRITLENIGLKSELKSVQDELRFIGDERLQLEKELINYKKIVQQTPGGSKEVIEHEISISSEEKKSKHPQVGQQNEVTSTESISTGSQSSVKGQMSSKVRVQKFSKGSISIVECADDGSFIAIENFGVQVENLSDWYIERIVDNNPPLRYQFKQVSISPGMNIKIWSGNKTKEIIGKNDLIFDKQSWSHGNQAKTTLYNSQNEEKASYIQKTNYS